ncbi:hypothetical protein ACFV2H_01730 [Streptomyces sp. NPDC059629]|uniref:hypothetical protein n=1 Tax=Streptomyces sp. NPDC059629 TaxID=3346889 RepID=UPI003674496E
MRSLSGVRPGAGLAAWTSKWTHAHAAQWGTLGRLVAAVSRGSVPYGAAIDENTVLETADGGRRGPGRRARAGACRTAVG